MLFQFCYNYIPICSNIHLPIPNLFNPFIDYFPETSTFFYYNIFMVNTPYSQ